MTARVLAATFVTAAAAAFAGAAEAAKPERGPASSPPTLTFPAGMVCSFPVYAEAVLNAQTETIFSSGKVLYTGNFRSLVRNAAKPQNELTLQTSGPVSITPSGANLLVVSQGPVLFFFFPGDAGPGDVATGRTYLISGRAELLVDPATFTFLSFSYTGHARDICAELA